MTPTIKAFYHPPSGTLTYLVSDPITRATAIIDPVLDFDLCAGKVTTTAADEIIDYVKQQHLNVHWLLETHAHADHLSGADYLKQQLGGKTAIGQGITFVQQTFKAVFNLADDFCTSGSQFDQLLYDGDCLPLGNLAICVLTTPGHTSDCVTYVVGNNAFIGDTLFMPEAGTARCDFPGGDAALLFDSIQKIYALGDDTTLWVCHNYPPQGCDVMFETTVSEQKADNVHLPATCGKADFTAIRTSRDNSLNVPKLLYPAVQVNIRAGVLPEPENNDVAYLKIPLS
ncbi:MAG: glyoxylase-like metal-dependent hydrolase (beta-lactamase superfamily II) [Phenylobacterium sp.]|jgi:glyoxylase-like metal-dependent hydrolase (beta-lactamase superfamily II)